MKDPFDWMGPLLSEMGVVRFEAHLSGGGDEGRLDELLWFGRDGPLSDEAMSDRLESMKIPSGASFTSSFRDLLEESIDRAASAHGDYVNNDGGYVHLVFEIVDGRIEEIEGGFTPWERDDEDPEPDDEDEDADFDPEA